MWELGAVCDLVCFRPLEWGCWTKFSCNWKPSPFSDNWSGPGLPVPEPHGPGGGPGCIPGVPRCFKFMTWILIGRHTECHYLWFMGELVICTEATWAKMLIQKIQTFLTIWSSDSHPWTLRGYFHCLTLIRKERSGMCWILPCLLESLWMKRRSWWPIVTPEECNRSTHWWSLIKKRPLYFINATSRPLRNTKFM